jgi:predicted alpha/beta hydrolase family esterase
MSFGRAAHLAKVWGSDLVDLGYAGHINVASGFGPWAKGKALRDDLFLAAADQPVRLPRPRRTAV